MTDPDDLVARLREGCIERPKRWTGDMHADLGGPIMADETDALMREAAAEIERLRAERAKIFVSRNRWWCGCCGAVWDAHFMPAPATCPDCGLIYDGSDAEAITLHTVSIDARAKMEGETL